MNIPAYTPAHIVVLFLADIDRTYNDIKQVYKVKRGLVVPTNFGKTKVTILGKQTAISRKAGFAKELAISFPQY